MWALDMCDSSSQVNSIYPSACLCVCLYNLKLTPLHHPAWPAVCLYVLHGLHGPSMQSPPPPPPPDTTVATTTTTTATTGDTSLAMQISQPLVPLVDEFAGRLFGELDYIQEGHSCEKFAKLYAHVPRIRTPGIHWSATAHK